MYGAGFAAIVFGIYSSDQESDLVHCYQRNLLPRCKWFLGIWAMVNDAIDYQELTTGDRKEGMVYATYILLPQACFRSTQLSSFTLAPDRI